MYLYKVRFDVSVTFTDRKITPLKVVKETEKSFICYEPKSTTKTIVSKDRLSRYVTADAYGMCVYVHGFCTKEELTALETIMIDRIDRHVKSILKEANQIALRVAEDFTLNCGHYDYGDRVRLRKEHKAKK